MPRTQRMLSWLVQIAMIIQHSVCLRTEWSSFSFDVVVGSGANVPPRGFHAATAFKDIMYIFGGDDTTNNYDDLWAFKLEQGEEDALNFTWHQVCADCSDSPSPRRKSAMEVVHNLTHHSLFVYGGQNTEGFTITTFCDLWRIDLFNENGSVAAEWSRECAGMTTGVCRGSRSMGAHGDSVYILEENLRMRAYNSSTRSCSVICEEDSTACCKDGECPPFGTRREPIARHLPVVGSRMFLSGGYPPLSYNDLWEFRLDRNSSNWSPLCDGVDKTQCGDFEMIEDSSPSFSALGDALFILERSTVVHLELDSSADVPSYQWDVITDEQPYLWSATMVAVERPWLSDKVLVVFSGRISGTTYSTDVWQLEVSETPEVPSPGLPSNGTLPPLPTPTPLTSERPSTLPSTTTVVTETPTTVAATTSGGMAPATSDTAGLTSMPPTPAQTELPAFFPAPTIGINVGIDHEGTASDSASSSTPLLAIVLPSIIGGLLVLFCAAAFMLKLKLRKLPQLSIKNAPEHMRQSNVSGEHDGGSGANPSGGSGANPSGGSGANPSGGRAGGDAIGAKKFSPETPSVSLDIAPDANADSLVRSRGEKVDRRYGGASKAVASAPVAEAVGGEGRLRNPESINDVNDEIAPHEVLAQLTKLISQVSGKHAKQPRKSRPRGNQRQMPDDHDASGDVLHRGGTSGSISLNEDFHERKRSFAGEPNFPVERRSGRNSEDAKVDGEVDGEIDGEVDLDGEVDADGGRDIEYDEVGYSDEDSYETEREEGEPHTEDFDFDELANALDQLRVVDSESDSESDDEDHAESERRAMAPPVPAASPVPAGSLPKQFPCAVCGFNFTSKANLITHKREQHRKRDYKFECDECGKKFYRKHNLQIHRRTHLPKAKRGFWCLLCQKSFSQKVNFARHITDAHDKPGKCRICRHRVASEEEFARHAEAVHSGAPSHRRKFGVRGKTWNMCPCGKNFKSLTATAHHKAQCPAHAKWKEAVREMLATSSTGENMPMENAAHHVGLSSSDVGLSSGGIKSERHDILPPSSSTTPMMLPDDAAPSREPLSAFTSAAVPSSVATAPTVDASGKFLIPSLKSPLDESASFVQKSTLSSSTTHVDKLPFPRALDAPSSRISSIDSESHMIQGRAVRVPSSSNIYTFDSSGRRLVDTPVLRDDASADPKHSSVSSRRETPFELSAQLDVLSSPTAPRDLPSHPHRGGDFGADRPVATPASSSGGGGSGGGSVAMTQVRSTRRKREKRPETSASSSSGGSSLREGRPKKLASSSSGDSSLWGQSKRPKRSKVVGVHGGDGASRSHSSSTGHIGTGIQQHASPGPKLSTPKLEAHKLPISSPQHVTNTTSSLASHVSSWLHGTSSDGSLGAHMSVNTPDSPSEVELFEAPQKSMSRNVNSTAPVSRANKPPFADLQTEAGSTQTTSSPKTVEQATFTWHGQKLRTQTFIPQLNPGTTKRSMTRARGTSQPRGAPNAEDSNQRNASFQAAPNVTRSSFTRESQDPQLSITPNLNVNLDDREPEQSQTPALMKMMSEYKSPLSADAADVRNPPPSADGGVATGTSPNLFTSTDGGVAIGMNADLFPSTDAGVAIGINADLFPLADGGVAIGMNADLLQSTLGGPAHQAAQFGSPRSNADTTFGLIAPSDSTPHPIIRSSGTGDTQVDDLSKLVSSLSAKALSTTSQENRTPEASAIPPSSPNPSGTMLSQQDNAHISVLPTDENTALDDNPTSRVELKSTKSSGDESVSDVVRPGSFTVDPNGFTDQKTNVLSGAQEDSHRIDASSRCSHGGSHSFAPAQTSVAQHAVNSHTLQLLDVAAPSDGSAVFIPPLAQSHTIPYADSSSSFDRAGMLSLDFESPMTTVSTRGSSSSATLAQRSSVSGGLSLPAVSQAVPHNSVVLSPGVSSTINVPDGHGLNHNDESTVMSNNSQGISSSFRGLVAPAHQRDDDESLDRLSQACYHKPPTASSASSHANDLRAAAPTVHNSRQHFPNPEDALCASSSPIHVGWMYGSNSSLRLQSVTIPTNSIFTANALNALRQDATAHVPLAGAIKHAVTDRAPLLPGVEHAAASHDSALTSTPQAAAVAIPFLPNVGQAAASHDSVLISTLQAAAVGAPLLLGVEQVTASRDSVPISTSQAAATSHHDTHTEHSPAVVAADSSSAFDNAGMLSLDFESPMMPLRPSARATSPASGRYEASHYQNEDGGGSEGPSFHSSSVGDISEGDMSVVSRATSFSDSQSRGLRFRDNDSDISDDGYSGIVFT